MAKKSKTPSIDSLTKLKDQILAEKKKADANYTDTLGKMNKAKKAIDKELKNPSADKAALSKASKEFTKASSAFKETRKQSVKNISDALKKINADIKLLSN